MVLGDSMFLVFFEVMTELKQEQSFFENIEAYRSAGMQEIQAVQQAAGFETMQVQEHASGLWNMHKYWYKKEEASGSSELTIEDKAAKSATDKDGLKQLFNVESKAELQDPDMAIKQEFRANLEILNKHISDFMTLANKATMKSKEYIVLCKADKTLKPRAEKFQAGLDESKSWATAVMERMAVLQLAPESTTVEQFQGYSNELTGIVDTCKEKMSAVRAAMKHNDGVFAPR